MTTPPSSNPLPVSPISRVPYDVLREIFVHCLPQYRLQARQPNTTIAPMLLCQICSAWRTVALNSASLWSHLSYCLTVVDANTDPGDNRDWQLLKNQLAFLSWWRRNHDMMAPSICLDITRLYDKPELEPDAVKTMSLFQYIVSAQYLETNLFFWSILYEWNKVGQRNVYPNSHTLVKSDYGRFDAFYTIHTLIPNHTPSALRYLSLDNDILFPEFVIPNNWSKLTRVALERVVMPLSILLSFIRSVPDLQWMHLDVSWCDGEYTQLTQCTLPHASAFHIMLCDVPPSSILEFPLRTLFTNLHLPALHTLSLFSSQESWFDCRIIAELYAVLNSTPAVATLTLGDCFLTLDRIYPTRPGIGVVMPIWHYATHLVHLRLKMVRTRGMDEAAAKKEWDMSLRNFFHRDHHWLDLDNPACHIQKITMINEEGSEHWEKDVKSYVIARIQDHVEDAPNIDVVFDIIFDTADQFPAGAWNEWGPNLVHLQHEITRRRRIR